MGIVIAVANNKGGVAKTTTACNLAHGLAMDIEAAGGGVILVDLDPQSSAAKFFGVYNQVYSASNQNGSCISFYLTNQANLAETVIHLDRPDDGLPRPNLYLIPASRELEYTTEDLIANETDRLRDEARGRRGRKAAPPLDDLLTHYLAPVIEQFDYVILDCPPKLDTLKTAVYNVADYVIAPTAADYMSVSGLMEHTEDLASLKEFKQVKAELALVVPTVVRSREVLDREMRDLLVETYGAERVADPIPASVSIKQSPAAGGRSIFEYKPNTPASDAYWHLAQRVRNELT